MALLSLILFLFLFPLLMIESHSHPISQSFNNLQGCHKGQTIEGLHEIKHYLHKFGYLPNHYTTRSRNIKNNDDDDDDDFDEELELAIKTYQLNYHLNVTGALDGQTIYQMGQTRCGVPDIINGKSWMRSGKGRQLGSSNTKPHIVSRYAFFNGAPKWPPASMHLKYGALALIEDVDPATLSSVLSSAFSRWASVSKFTFEETKDLSTADLQIGFYRRDHGDGWPFDGPGNIVAHAAPPTSGFFHYDAEETWSTNLAPNTMDLESVAVHEIGHLLGLAHTSVPEAIMFPTLASGVRKVELNADDIQGIQALYS